MQISRALKLHLLEVAAGSHLLSAVWRAEAGGQLGTELAGATSIHAEHNWERHYFRDSIWFYLIDASELFSGKTRAADARFSSLELPRTRPINVQISDGASVKGSTVTLARHAPLLDDASCPTFKTPGSLSAASLAHGCRVVKVWARLRPF